MQVVNNVYNTMRAHLAQTDAVYANDHRYQMLNEYTISCEFGNCVSIYSHKDVVTHYIKELASHFKLKRTTKLSNK